MCIRDSSHEYFARMEAINFTQTHDDGAATRDLAKAQVVLVGVSRCGKTPTSLYLALQFGVRAAEGLMLREGIPMVDTTSKSIEEIATTILHRAKLERHVY